MVDNNLFLSKQGMALKLPKLPVTLRAMSLTVIEYEFGEYRTELNEWTGSNVAMLFYKYLLCE